MEIPLKEMIFADSNAFIAIRNLNHPLHRKALQTSHRLQKNKEEIITTNIVISEVLTILAMRVSKVLALEFGKEIIQLRPPVVYIDDLYHQRAWEIFQKIQSKNVSFFDCTSFAVMEDLDIKKAFSFDKDFEKYGFELV